MLLRSIGDIMPDAIAQRLAELLNLSKPSLGRVVKGTLPGAPADPVA